MAFSHKFFDEFLKLEGEHTPAYVFELDELSRRVEKVKSCLGEKAQLCYAMKANPFLVEPMKDLVPAFEVCSPGEFRICERSGIPMEQIVLSGVYKNPQDIQYVLKTYEGKGVYTVESLQQLALLQKEASVAGLVIPVLLRVTSGNQFGLDEQEIRRIISQRESYLALQILGLQMYSGTQKKALSQMEEELQYLDGLLEELKETCGFQAAELEYGPGFFVPYFKKDKPEELEEMLAEFGKILDSLHFSGKIILEMGRFLAALCGYFITSIVDKKVNQEQSYVIVDGGIHHLNYYGQTMAMKQPYCTQFTPDGQEKEPGEEAWNLCGSLCTVSDVIVKRFPLNQPELGDLLVFERVGAYSVTEGIYLFLSRPLPEIYFWSEEKGLQLVRENLHTDVLNSVR